MKATGIVRRIDDLVRVVIPKEIRRTLRIREGDPLEIYTDKEGEVVLKKYSPIGELAEFAGEYAEALYQSTGIAAIITDRDNVVAIAGTSKKDYMSKNISQELDKTIEEKTFVNNITESKYIPVTSEGNEKVFHAQMIQPILSGGDPIGSIIMCTLEAGKTLGDTEGKLLETASNFLGKQMEQ